MKKDDIIKIYIEQWDKASDFLDKAILTLSTSTIWLVTLSNIQEKINHNCLFNLWVTLITITLISVLFSYLIAIYNCQLGINYFNEKLDSAKINNRMNENNKYINKLRYLYVITSLVWILFLIISILHG
jgi:hypothetical protein